MRFIGPNIFLYFFLILLGISGFFFAVVYPQTEGFYAFIIFAAIGGFGVASYIRYTKSKHAHLVCPVGSDCDAVVTSRYAKFLGLSLEYWGMAYYAVIILSYILLLFAPHLLSDIFLSGLMILTATAFLFSLYLLFVQAFLLRQWCIWCLLSAILSIAIFIFSLVSIDFAISILANITGFIDTLHNLGFVFGLGGATATISLFFLRFLKDLDIDEGELQTLKGMSELVWLGLIFTLISQFAYFILYPEILAQSGPFLVQTASLFVVVISNAVLMIIFTPFLAEIPFNNKAEGYHHHSFESLRRPFFIAGAIALSSWYFAFIMNYLPDYKLSTLIFIYATVLVVAIFTSLFLEKRISKKTP